jgi:hypothetical protein
MKALLNILCWSLKQVNNGDNTCLYMEVVDLEDFESIVAKECRIVIHRRVLEFSYI